jgi:hypothetical protein
MNTHIEHAADAMTEKMLRVSPGPRLQRHPAYKKGRGKKMDTNEIE